MIPSNWASGGTHGSEAYDSQRSDLSRTSYKTMTLGISAAGYSQSRETVASFGSEAPAPPRILRAEGLQQTGRWPTVNPTQQPNPPASQRDLGPPEDTSLAAKLEEERALWSKSMEEYFAKKLRSIQEEINKSKEEALIMINRAASQCKEQFRQLNNMEREMNIDELRNNVSRLKVQVSQLEDRPEHLQLSNGESIEHVLDSHRESIEVLMRERQPKQLQVKIASAQNLPSKDTFCICELEGKPHSKLQTHVVAGNANPVWNYVGDMPDFTAGDSLEVSVYEKDSCVLSLIDKVVLPSQAFYPGGFFGDIDLSETGATVKLEVTFVDESAPGASALSAAAKEAVATAELAQEEVELLKKRATTLDQKLMLMQHMYKEALDQLQSKSSESSNGNSEVDAKLVTLEEEIASLQQRDEDADQTLKQLEADSAVLRQCLSDTREVMAEKLLKAYNLERKARIELAREIERKCKIHLPQADENYDDGSSTGSTLYNAFSSIFG